MAQGLKVNGEVQILEDSVLNQGFIIGMYNDSVDNLPDNATVDMITTEPDRFADYERQTVSGMDLDLDDNDNATATLPEVIFSVEENTEVIDAVFVLNEDTEELQFTSLLDEERDLGEVETLINNNVGISLR